MLAWVYQKYFNTLSKGFFLRPSSDSANTKSELPSSKLKTQQEWDDEATKLGNTYRGAGVSVALLGALIVFTALTPSALNLSEDISQLINVLEIALLALVLWLVHKHQKQEQRDTRQLWIEARTEAERLRYETLRRLTDAKSELNTAYSIELKTEIQLILDDQIGYNQKKQAKCERIEHVTDKVSVVGFSFAFLGASAHIFIHTHLLLYATVFVPALIGALHGINSFLQLSRHAVHHEEIANNLIKIKNHLKAEIPPQELNALGDQLYQLLTDSDQIWGKRVTQTKANL